MKIEFDPAKDTANRHKHGLDLSFGEQVLLDPDLLEFLDDTLDYGEDRFLALGLVAGIVYAMVYTEREDAIRIISVRVADKREQARYFSR
ncbi:BrnT family toxin [Nitrospirillum sp. BR 11164]|uniref:BrnT family toxin n=1 Tax=Nitrospirillum sp. BR 11164 TaxID=3104324 RepID=UPI002AFEBF28|nr:BrnT family toxin [Nitrospirillum sp. BR 11164]MEA1649896.1 BrnT family toxin [Nitrospirillum sp. BR 11164]